MTNKEEERDCIYEAVNKIRYDYSGEAEKKNIAALSDQRLQAQMADTVRFIEEREKGADKNLKDAYDCKKVMEEEMITRYRLYARFLHDLKALIEEHERKLQS